VINLKNDKQDAKFEMQGLYAKLKIAFPLRGLSK